EEDCKGFRGHEGHAVCSVGHDGEPERHPHKPENGDNRPLAPERSGTDEKHCKSDHENPAGRERTAITSSHSLAQDYPMADAYVNLRLASREWQGFGFRLWPVQPWIFHQAE